MRKTLRVSVIFILSFILATVFAVPAYAAIGYSARPNLPDNQNANVSAYFDLNTQPGLTQELSIKVSNSNDKEITVEMEAHVASTNRSGDVVYVPVDNLAFTPKHLLTDMIWIPESRVTIPANSVQDVAFMLTVPEEPFEGIILGSVRVVEVVDKDKANAGGITNQYAYTIPIRLHQSGVDVEPDFLIDSVKAELVHFSASIVCNIVNPKPRLIRDMTVITKIYSEGNDTPVLEYVNEKVSMAPESLLPLTIEKEFGEGFPGGNYVAKITLQYEGKEWNLEKNFEITVEEAAKINERIIVSEDVPLSSAGFPVMTIVLITIGAVLILTVVIIAIFFRKHIKKYKEMMTKLDSTK